MSGDGGACDDAHILLVLGRQESFEDGITKKMQTLFGGDNLERQSQTSLNVDDSKVRSSLYSSGRRKSGDMHASARSTAYSHATQSSLNSSEMDASNLDWAQPLFHDRVREMGLEDRLGGSRMATGNDIQEALLPKDESFQVQLQVLGDERKTERGSLKPPWSGQPLHTASSLPVLGAELDRSTSVPAGRHEMSNRYGNVSSLESQRVGREPGGMSDPLNRVMSVSDRFGRVHSLRSNSFSAPTPTFINSRYAYCSQSRYAYLPLKYT